MELIIIGAIPFYQNQSLLLSPLQPLRLNQRGEAKSQLCPRAYVLHMESGFSCVSQLLCNVLPAVCF